MGHWTIPIVYIPSHPLLALAAYFLKKYQCHSTREPNSRSGIFFQGGREWLCKYKQCPILTADKFLDLSAICLQMCLTQQNLCLGNVAILLGTLCGQFSWTAKCIYQYQTPFMCKFLWNYEIDDAKKKQCRYQSCWLSDRTLQRNTFTFYVMFILRRSMWWCFGRSFHIFHKKISRRICATKFKLISDTFLQAPVL